MNRKQRLQNYAFVIASLPVRAGAWKRCRALVCDLAKSGVDCYLLAPESDAVRALDSLENIKTCELRVTEHHFGTIPFNLEVIRVLSQLNLEGYEQVWAGSFAGNSGFSLSLYFRHFSSVPATIFTLLRGRELDKLRIRLEDRPMYSWLRTAAQKFIVSTMLRNSDVVMTQTDVGFSQLQAEYPFLDDKPHYVLPNNLNVPWIANNVEALGEATGKWAGSGSRSESGRSTFRLCFVGSIKLDVKGIDTLVEAVSKIEADALQLDIVGDGPEVRELEKLIEQYGIRDRTTRYGWMENPMEVMNQSDLVIVPSRFDECPNVVLEALAVGVPVVGSNVDGIAVMLQHAELLFPPGNAEAIAEVVRRAIRDEVFYEEVVDLCSERAVEYVFDYGERFAEIVIDYERTSSSVSNCSQTSCPGSFKSSTVGEED